MVPSSVEDACQSPTGGYGRLPRVVKRSSSEETCSGDLLRRPRPLPFGVLQIMGQA